MNVTPSTADCKSGSRLGDVFESSAIVLSRPSALKMKWPLGAPVSVEASPSKARSSVGVVSRPGASVSFGRPARRTAADLVLRLGRQIALAAESSDRRARARATSSRPLSATRRSKAERSRRERSGPGRQERRIERQLVDLDPDFRGAVGGEAAEGDRLVERLQRRFDHRHLQRHDHEFRRSPEGCSIAAAWRGALLQLRGRGRRLRHGRRRISRNRRSHARAVPRSPRRRRSRRPYTSPRRAGPDRPAAARRRFRSGS